MKKQHRRAGVLARQLRAKVDRVDPHPVNVVNAVKMINITFCAGVLSGVRREIA